MNEKEFEYNGVKLKAIPDIEYPDIEYGCADCYFGNIDCDTTLIYNLRPSCLSIKRKDETNVIFVEVKMKKIKLKDYTGEMVCAASRFKGFKFLYTNQYEEIKTFKENGYTILGTITVKVFDENFIKCSLKEFFEDHAVYYGYDDIEEKLDFDNEKYKKVEEAVREYIKSLGDVNTTYHYDTDTIIEVEDE